MSLPVTLPPSLPAALPAILPPTDADGNFPWEQTRKNVHITDKMWFRLRRTARFREVWNLPEHTKKNIPFQLSVACLTCGFSQQETVTVVRLWHHKHTESFDEMGFMKYLYPHAVEKAYPFVVRYYAKLYAEELRKIATDPGSRKHTRFIVSKYLANVKQATAQEVSDHTGITLKTVRNCILVLKETGKVQDVEYAVYRSIRSLFWDRLTGNSRETTIAEHSRFNRSIKLADNLTTVEVLDYCKARFVTVLVDTDRYEGELANHDWVVNHEGVVVFDGRPGVPVWERFSEHQRGKIEFITENAVDLRRANLRVVPAKGQHFGQRIIWTQDTSPEVTHQPG